MKTSLILFCAILFLNACKSKSASEAKDENKTNFPGAATSAAAVKKLITHKDFVTVKAGLFVPQQKGKVSPYEWFDINKDTSAMMKEIIEKEMSFELHFNFDSTGILFYGKQLSFDSSGHAIYIPYPSGITYRVEDSVAGEEEPGIKLRVFAEERDISGGRTQKLESRYIVTGADENGLVLEAPRSYLDKTVVVMMSVKDKKGINDSPNK